MNKDLLKKAASCLSIQDVYMRNSNVFVAEDYHPKYPLSKTVDLQFRGGAKACRELEVDKTGTDKKDRILQVYYEAAFRIVPPNIDDETKKDHQKMKELVLSEVVAQFVAEYIVTCDTLEEEAIKEFSRVNAGYHVWPFWREYALSTANRLKLPDFAIPLYKIPD